MPRIDGFARRYQPGLGNHGTWLVLFWITKSQQTLCCQIICKSNVIQGVHCYTIDFYKGVAESFRGIKPGQIFAV